MAKQPEPAMTDFERDLLGSMVQAKGGEFAEVHTPEQIAKRGRPVGSVKASTKVQISIRIAPDVVAGFKARGGHWQTQANKAMREWLDSHPVA